MAGSRRGDLLSCSFCGKTKEQVIKLIAGPGIYICDECVGLCVEIIAEEMAEDAGPEAVTIAGRLVANLDELSRLHSETRKTP